MYHILPLTYQSYDLSFSDWVSLLTLCLAPLIAHLVAGAPQPSVITSKRGPSWHQHIYSLNPTSILWRYAAIADRRVRARAWDATDMAATNALFWTSHGWDGSEAMIETSSPHCIRVPDHKRVAVFSRETAKTIIVTLQAIQALYTLAGFSHAQNFTDTMALNVVFFPIAFLSLVRLPSCFWLTEDLYYCASPPRSPPNELLTSAPTDAKGSRAHRVSVDSLIDQQSGGVLTEGRFRPTSFWGSRLLRVLIMLPIIGVWTMAIIFTFPGYMTNSRVFTATLVVFSAFYIFFLTATILIVGYYFIRGRTTTTILPCSETLWYKAYTLLLLGLGLAMMAVAAIETRRTTCGEYTSWPGIDGDLMVCRSDEYRLVPVDTVSPNSSVVSISANFGLATTFPLSDPHNQTTLGPQEFWVFNFTGNCLGQVEPSHTYQHVKTMDTVDMSDMFRNITFI
ncbi:hypothetical protein F4780DRAFT_275434 [Xylariomycetidae sp. FL0641]|nr:hypothetical protein F4780DRAFT_275434 [Xylariomycetidae sp. FL0641]